MSCRGPSEAARRTSPTQCTARGDCLCRHGVVYRRVVLVAPRYFPRARLGGADDEESYRSYLASAKLDPRSLMASHDLYRTAVLLGGCRRAELHATAILAIELQDVNARTTAADYELQCTGNAERAGELVRGYEFTSDDAVWAALAAAAFARDWERAIELLDEGEILYGWWGDRAQDQLQMAMLLRMNDQGAASDALLDIVESAISANEPPAESPFRDNAYKGIRMRYAALRGDDVETRRWADELSRNMQRAGAFDPITRATAYRFFAFEFADAGQADRAIDALELMRIVAGRGPLLQQGVDRSCRSASRNAICRGPRPCKKVSIEAVGALLEARPIPGPRPAPTAPRSDFRRGSCAPRRPRTPARSSRCRPRAETPARPPRPCRR